MIFYLDERIVVPVEVTVSETGLYRYNVSNTKGIVFVGNVFIDENSGGVIKLDVTDIIRGQLTIPSFFESFPLPQQISNSNTTEQPIYEKFQIAVVTNEITFVSETIEVYMYYRYPLMKEELNNGLKYNESSVNSLWVSLQGRYSINGVGYFKLTPHYPAIATYNYCVAIAGYCTNGLINNSGTNIELRGIYSSDTDTNKKHRLNILTNNYCGVVSLESLFDDTYTVTTNDYSIWFMGDEIGKIDLCPAKYYLMWQDRAGSFQSQPFDKVSTYSETFDREYITNYKGVKRPTTITNSPKIKIQTGYIDEKLYPYYESIFTSPYLLLYDTKEDKSYLVNVTGDYTEKTFKNQGRQMFNIQLDLEFAKNQNMVY